MFLLCCFSRNDNSDSASATSAKTSETWKTINELWENMSAIEDKTKAQWRDLERSFLEAPDDEDEDSFRVRADAVPGPLADMEALRLEFDALGNQ